MYGAYELLPAQVIFLPFWRVYFSAILAGLNMTHSNIPWFIHMLHDSLDRLCILGVHLKKCVYVCICVSVHVFVRSLLCICAYVCVQRCLYVPECVRTCISVRAFVCVCMRVSSLVSSCYVLIFSHL